MKKILVYISIYMASIVCLSPAQVSRADETRTLWPSNSLTKVLRNAKPAETDRVLDIQGARGEIVSAQAVFRTADHMASAGAAITDLRHQTSDSVIPSQQIRLQWLRYIDITQNTKGIPRDELVAQAPISIPDPYWEDATIHVSARQAQPIWIEIHVPSSANAGDYIGELSITDKTTTTTLPIKLHVWNFEVPRQRHLSVVNWWQFPGTGFKDRVKPYSDQYWQLLDKFCAFLVEHRQTDVNTSIGLIKESGDDAKGYKYDTSLLERYAEIAFQAGIRQIQLHSLGRRTAERGNPAGRIELMESNLRRLAALEKVIRKRNWKGRFVAQICDEPLIHHEQSYIPLIDRAHEIAPSVRIIEAVETEYLGNLDIYVPKISHLNLWYPSFEQARRNGAELWFYTCCDPRGRYPNRFLDQSLLKVRVLHWINYLYDLDGYLHWGLNQFDKGDPYSEKAIGGRWPAGDRAIAYPGKNRLVGSLRFSALRDGLEDYEYLWVLENELRKIKERLGNEAFWLDPRRRSLELCRRVVRSFDEYTRDPQVMLDTRRAIAEEIEALQTLPLLLVQTSPPEGTTVPAGPRLINIRGLVPPAASVSVNGKPVRNIRPSGYFTQFHTLHDGHPKVTVQVEHQGKKRTATRKFNLTD
ncbi:MAG: DUF4091 domain-containing protein [Planctomycetota bacterium]|nr:MAG: DUF4091 domain-containing protein [Planctomycetota bacterium]